MEAHFRHLFLFWSDKNWVYMRANRCLTKSAESSIRVFSNIIQSESGAYLMCSRQHIRDREILVTAANWTLRPLPCYFSLLSNCIFLRTRVRSLDFWNYLTTQNHALTSAKYTSKQAHAPEGTQQWVFAPDDIAVSSVWKFNNWVDVRRHISLDQPCWGKTEIPCHVWALYASLATTKYLQTANTTAKIPSPATTALFTCRRDVSALFCSTPLSILTLDWLESSCDHVWSWTRSLGAVCLCMWSRSVIVAQKRIDWRWIMFVMGAANRPCGV